MAVDRKYPHPDQVGLSQITAPSLFLCDLCFLLQPLPRFQGANRRSPFFLFIRSAESLSRAPYCGHVQWPPSSSPLKHSNPPTQCFENWLVIHSEKSVLHSCDLVHVRMQTHTHTPHTHTHTFMNQYLTLTAFFYPTIFNLFH